MLITSHYLRTGSPRTCCHCREPFPFTGEHFVAWRGRDNRYYCQPDCEQFSMEGPAPRLKVLA